MKKLLFIIFVLLNMNSIAAQTYPVNSTTNGSDVWYYIQCLPRTADLNAKWLTGGNDGTILTVKVLDTTNDSQLWKIVDNAGGIALVNKEYGTYLNADKEPYVNVDLNNYVIPSISSAPALGLKLAPYFDQLALPNGFYLVNKEATNVSNTANASLTFQFYSAGSGAEFRPINYGANAPNINSGIIFRTNKDLLLDAINTSKTAISNISIGENPGQFSTEVVTALQSAINASQTVYDNAAATSNEVVNSASQLTLALSTFNSSVILPELSTNTTQKWYYIQAPREAYNYMSSLGSLSNIKDIPAIPDDSQLWKLVANTNGTADGFALVNKATGEYLDADIPQGGNIFKTRADMPIINLRFIKSTSNTDKISTFIIENTGTTVTTRIHAGASNTSWHALNYTASATDNCNWLFVEYNNSAKVILKGLLTQANTTYNLSSAGGNPGQFTQDAKDGYKEIIDAAQEIYDDPNSTLEECNNISSELSNINSTFASMVTLPEISSGANEIWYFIQGKRPTNSYMTAAAAGSNLPVKSITVIPDDTQLWKLVENGSGFALVNKATGEYLNTDDPYTHGASGINLTTRGDIPANTLRFIMSTEKTNNAFRFWIENSVGSTPVFRLHAGVSYVLNWTGNANDNSTWLFMAYDELFKADFTNARNAARTLYNESTEGNEFGQFSSEMRTALNAVISAAEAMDMDEMSNEELTAETKVLNDAMAAYKPNTDIALLASITKNKWFRLINGAPASVGGGYAYNKAMSSNGRIENTAFTFEDINENSDAQLFRFIMNPDNTKAWTIVNKANNMYIGYNGMIVSTPTPDNEFEITALDAMNFTIKPTTSSTLHAAQSGSVILNYAGGLGTASSWKIKYVSENDVTDFVTPYTQKRTMARNKLDVINPLSGTEIGQYSASTVSTLSSILTTEEAKDPATMTNTELIQGITDLNAAMAGLAVNTDVKLLISATSGNYKWFRIVNAAASTVTYASGMAMSSYGRLDGEKYTFENKDNTSAAQLFRFELNPNQTNVANIINKDLGSYVGHDGLIIVSPETENEFEITQLANGTSFWIYPTYIDNITDPATPVRVNPLHAAQNGSVILNWYAGVGSASAWSFELAFEEPSALSTIKTNDYVVRVNNGIISVNGIENFDVYSTVGQKLNKYATLSAGIYLVKIGNTKIKVLVK